MKTSESARASAKSTARCRFAGGSPRSGFAVVAALCALGAGAGAGCDDPAMPGVGTGGAAGTNTGGTSGTGTGGATGGGGMSGACSDPTGLDLGIASRASEGAGHTVFVCDPVSYLTVPPSSGTHYPIWPAYRTYAQPVPWGFLVHGLEHGAVEIVYNCPGGCPDEVATAQAWIDLLAPNANCTGLRPRVILAPDPTLDVRWAATAWTWTLRACAFDQPMFQQFFDEHYDAAPESVCDDGVDLSAQGWCP